MKKIFKIIAITIIILILGIVILFCSKINKISLIENIREKIAKTEENKQNISKVTTIDVTNLEDNNTIKHEHSLKTEFDNTQHWEKCTICGEKVNIVNHIYIDKGWTMGNSCSESNVHKFTCNCGYSYETTVGRTPHRETKNDTDTFQGYDWCSVCHNHGNPHNCAKSDGSRINCLNLGTCVVNNHGHTYTPSDYWTRHIGYKNDLNEIYCTYCNLYLGKVNYSYLEKISDTVFKHYSSITVDDKVKYNSMTRDSFFGGNSRITNNSASVNGTTWSQVNTIEITGHTEAVGSATAYYLGILNGISLTVQIIETYKIDTISPTINITQENREELTEWSRTKPIIISGTENYCNTVKIKIIDEKEEIIFEGETKVNNKNYSISCTPRIETGIEGRKFKCIVTDNLKNSAEQEFTIAKVDNIPPEPTSEIILSPEWAKSKECKITAIDGGIGNVKIAVADISDLKSAELNETEYSRNYNFVGDAYQEKEISILYEDGLGNQSIQMIKINKLDNTAPSITNATLHNNKLIIESHDRHESLGEGSGVVKYRYLASEEKLENLELTNENSIEVMKDEEIKIKDIYKIKYIYVVAEDLVGNTSEVYEFEVPQLKLTSTVNLNTTNGKGEIILDWSSYDVEDKYFVVYRKKENETEWETIVSLEEKLTGSKYTDILANDEANPSIPNITINGGNQNNNINVTANSSDNGTKYIYYIEAYDSTGTLLSKSN